ncbi:MFS transporter [Myxococcota bacterium]|nr:MFS transporter [Myxococcota bacterium]
MSRTKAEESLGASPGEAALNPADSVAMGVQSAHAPHIVEPARVRAFVALRHREYRLLFIAFLVNQIGFWISHISLQGLMVELTDNDARQSGLLFFALFLPASVVAPVAGVAADRFDRKRIVLVCYAAVAVVTAALSVFTHLGWMTPERLLLLALLMGTSFAVSGPANMAIAANAVPEHDLPSAVSMQSASNNLTRVLGPTLAAPLLVGERFDISFGIYFVATIVAALLIAQMRLSPYLPDYTESGIFSRVRSGVEHAHQRYPALPALLTVATLSLLGVSHTVLLPIYAEEVLGDRDWFAWLVVATGMGAFVGAIVAGSARRPPSLARSALAVAAYGAFFALFAVSRAPTLAMFAQVLIGYFYFAVMTSLQTLIQQIVDEPKRGRVMSLFQIAWAGLVPFGSLGMGYCADILGTVPTLLGAAVLLGLFGLAMSLWVHFTSPTSIDRILDPA